MNPAAAPNEAHAVDDSPVEAPQGRWPEHQISHPAILSRWKDPFLLIRAESGVVRRFDLAEVPLPRNCDVGGTITKSCKLGDFPHWMDVCKAYAALALHDTSAYTAVDIVSNALGNVYRFFAWCIRRRVLHLNVLTESDLKAFARELQPNGWFSALPIEPWIRAALDEAKADENVRSRLISHRRNNSFVSFNTEGLSREIGCVVTQPEYPSWMGEHLQELSPDASIRFQVQRARKDRAWSASSFKNCFVAVRRLSRIAAPLDRLTFDPFPNTRAAAIASGGRPDGRTPNLPIEEAGRLLGTSLSWIYEKSPGVEELLRIWTDAKASAEAAGLNGKSIPAACLRVVNKAYPEIAARFDLPRGKIGLASISADGLSIADFLQRIQTSAVVLIGINQARRKNEVTGEDDRPWGVYAGCVSRSDPFVEAYEIDMYIEKTWRDWRKMPANRITADVVGVLERLRVAMPGPAMRVSDDVSERRKNKLFVFPTQAHDRNAELAEYRFSKHSDTLFKEAKVDPKWRRTHQFRRLFALLYMYRHDHPSLQALSEMLCHLDIECTRTYVTDASMVAEAERIAVLYRCQDEAPLEELAEARREYAEEQIRAMLTSAEAGGTLTRRVRRWVKALVSKVEFDADDLERALAAVRTKMDKRGYSPESYPHGICWASHRHASRASCGRGGDLAREHAGIDVCSKCPFHSTSVAFLENVERDLRQLREAEDAAACSAEAATVRQEIVALEGLLAMERRLMEREWRQDSDRAVLEEPA